MPQWDYEEENDVEPRRCLQVMKERGLKKWLLCGILQCNLSKKCQLFFAKPKENPVPVELDPRPRNTVPRTSVMRNTPPSGSPQPPPAPPHDPDKDE